MHSWLISQFAQIHGVESFTAVSVMSLRRFAFSQRLHMLNTLMANLLLIVQVQLQLCSRRILAVKVARTQSHFVKDGVANLQHHSQIQWPRRAMSITNMYYQLHSNFEFLYLAKLFPI